MFKKYRRPSSSRNSEGSKPLLLTWTGSDHSPSIVGLVEVVVHVAQGRADRRARRGAAVALHVGVDQVEQTVVVAQARGPDAAGIRVAAHVELARPA
jgi:hypothetical protein